MPDASPRHPATAKSFKWHVQRVFASAYLEVVVGVNDFVVSGEYGAYLLAQAATNRGLMSVFTELMTYERGNEFYRIAVPSSCVGKSFGECLATLKDEHDVILVAVHPQGGSMQINPKEHRFEADDDVVVIAEKEPNFS